MTQWYTQQDIADLLGVSLPTVRKWRTEGLKYTKLAHNVVRIKKADLDKWLKSHERVAE